VRHHILDGLPLRHWSRGARARLETQAKNETSVIRAERAASIWLEGRAAQGERYREKKRTFILTAEADVLATDAAADGGDEAGEEDEASDLTGVRLVPRMVVNKQCSRRESTLFCTGREEGAEVWARTEAEPRPPVLAI
jgi:hypothetical protein